MPPLTPRSACKAAALPGPKYPEMPADPIIVHPDVRRNLMTIRAFNEAARALVIWTALKSDIAHRSNAKTEVQAAADSLGLLTPVLKGVLTDMGFDSTVKAQQVLGGHGYVEEWGMEQFVRDARIAMIYEGTNGIQALDLVGRKLPKDGGRAMMGFLGEVKSFISDNEADASLSPYLLGLERGVAHLEQATMWFMQNAIAKPENAGAGSYDYMHLFGLVALGYMWAQIAKAAIAGKVAGNGDGRRDGSETHHRQVFHGAHHARDNCPPRPHLGWRRNDDGAAGRAVFDIRARRSTMRTKTWRTNVPEAFIYDHVRTPRGRGKPEAPCTKSRPLGSRRQCCGRSRNAAVSTPTSSTMSCSAASIPSAKRAATSPGRRRSPPITATMCRGFRSTAFAPRASTRSTSPPRKSWPANIT